MDLDLCYLRLLIISDWFNFRNIVVSSDFHRLYIGYAWLKASWFVSSNAMKLKTVNAEIAFSLVQRRLQAFDKRSLKNFARNLEPFSQSRWQTNKLITIKIYKISRRLPLVLFVYNVLRMQGRTTASRVRISRRISRSKSERSVECNSQLSGNAIINSIVLE